MEYNDPLKNLPSIPAPDFTIADALRADAKGVIRSEAAQEKWAQAERDKLTPVAMHDARELGQLLNDKRERGDITWRDINGVAKKMQALRSALSLSQDTAQLSYPDATEPLMFVPFSDWHLGSFGSDYDLMEEFVDIIKSYGIRVAWIGDMCQMSIKLRSVLEVADNLLTPDMQMIALESFIEEVLPYTLFSTWDNHSVEREEKVVGYSRYAELWKRKTVWFSGIGHFDLTVANETYRGAAAHFFQGRSIYSNVAGQLRYMRLEACDREFAVAGDSHVPGMYQGPDGGVLRTAINAGNLQKNSGYAKRYFSLMEHPHFPCAVFRHDRHAIVPFWNLQEMLQYMGKI